MPGAKSNETLQSKYAVARNLIDIESLKDTAENPFKSLYSAKEELKACLEILQTAEISKKDLLKAQILYDIGRIDADTEEPGLGQALFAESLELLENAADTLEHGVLRIACLGQMGYILFKHNKTEEAIAKLKKAEVLYGSMQDQLVKEGTSLDDIQHHGELLNADFKPYSSQLEEEYTRVLYYLAQIYQSQGDDARAAMYCHSTLKKQVSFSGAEFDMIDWAINAATLSQFFVVNGDFRTARHHLACASVQLQMLQDKCPEEDKERLERRTADVNRCWAKYCLMLLVASSERLAKPPEDQGEMPPLRQTLLKPEITQDFEKRVSADFVVSYEEATKVFLSGQSFLKAAESFYTMENHATDFSQIAQEHSKLYRQLAFFTDDVDKKCKLLKRPIDILEAVVSTLSERFYKAIVLQILFELGELYQEMVELKYSLLPPKIKPTAHAAKKINTLIQKAIKHYTSFLRLARGLNASSVDSPDRRYDDDVARPALIARFCVGRLFSKFIADNVKEQMMNVERTKEYYDWVQSYCRKFPEHEALVTEEMKLMQELLELIPVSFQNLVKQTIWS